MRVLTNLNQAEQDFFDAAHTIYLNNPLSNSRGYIAVTRGVGAYLSDFGPSIEELVAESKGNPIYINSMGKEKKYYDECELPILVAKTDLLTTIIDYLKRNFTLGS
jgi:hypothetical protein